MRTYLFIKKYGRKINKNLVATSLGLNMKLALFYNLNFT
jgi:hypothetical protein